MNSLRRIALGTFIVSTACAVVASPVPPPSPKEKLPDTVDAVPLNDDERQEIRRTSSAKLKDIAVAFHNFSFANDDKLPSDWKDKNGKPLLSWRVLLLPYVGEDAIYRKFKLDEPWDSPHNIQVLEKMPDAFVSSRVKARKGFTVYQGFAGKGTAIGGKHLLSNIPDGTSQTIWCVEATAAVPWTKPADIPFDPMKDLPKFGNVFGDKPLALMMDGSTRYLDLKKLSERTLKAAIGADDGETLGPDW